MRYSLYVWTTQAQETWRSFAVIFCVEPMTCKLVCRLERVQTGGMTKLVNKCIFTVSGFDWFFTVEIAVADHYLRRWFSRH